MILHVFKTLPPREQYVMMAHVNKITHPYFLAFLRRTFKDIPGVKYWLQFCLFHEFEHELVITVPIGGNPKIYNMLYLCSCEYSCFCMDCREFKSSRWPSLPINANSVFV